MVDSIDGVTVSGGDSSDTYVVNGTIPNFLNSSTNNILINTPSFDEICNAIFILNRNNAPGLTVLGELSTILSGCSLNMMFLQLFYKFSNMGGYSLILM